MQMAFEELEELLDRQHGRAPLTSAEYFGLLAAAARSAVGPLAYSEDDPTPEDASWLVRQLSRLDLVKKEEFTSRCAKIRRPEVLTYGYQVRKGGFWVHRLLHSKHLQDERAASFRFWGRVHFTIACLVCLMIGEIYIAMVRDFLKYQREL
mmetsp:Transcript_100365/g.312756  ORF Transcript_100365/g.312756 Transcript_100365/m.312756 type:complete len:151 (-) Transcript_100365:49-501(-)